jgi:hypothetical protein
MRCERGPDAVLPDYCTLCKAERLQGDMRYQLVVERQQERVESFAGSTVVSVADARSCARWHMYRAAHAAMRGGEEQESRSKERDRFCDCVELFVRRSFPNPACDLSAEGQCDLLGWCVAQGHYRGFLTKQEGKDRRRSLWEEGWTPLWRDDHPY